MGLDFPLYHYKIELIRVIDGDTIEVNIDLGFGITIRKTVRLAKINAPEMNTLEGKVNRLELTHFLADKKLTAVTEKPMDKYGRWLATIYAGDISVNQWMIDRKLAKEYDV